MVEILLNCCEDLCGKKNEGITDALKWPKASQNFHFKTFLKIFCLFGISLAKRIQPLEEIINQKLDAYQNISKQMRQGIFYDSVELLNQTDLKSNFFENYEIFKNKIFNNFTKIHIKSNDLNKKKFCVIKIIFKKNLEFFPENQIYDLNLSILTNLKILVEKKSFKNNISADFYDMEISEINLQESVSMQNFLNEYSQTCTLYQFNLNSFAKTQKYIVTNHLIFFDTEIQSLESIFLTKNPFLKKCKKNFCFSTRIYICLHSMPSEFLDQQNLNKRSETNNAGKTMSLMDISRCDVSDIKSQNEHFYKNFIEIKYSKKATKRWIGEKGIDSKKSSEDIDSEEISPLEKESGKLTKSLLSFEDVEEQDRDESMFSDDIDRSKADLQHSNYKEITNNDVQVFNISNRAPLYCFDSLPVNDAGKCIKIIKKTVNTNLFLEICFFSFELVKNSVVFKIIPYYCIDDYKLQQDTFYTCFVQDILGEFEFTISLQSMKKKNTIGDTICVSKEQNLNINCVKSGKSNYSIKENITSDADFHKRDDEEILRDSKKNLKRKLVCRVNPDDEILLTERKIIDEKKCIDSFGNEIEDEYQSCIMASIKIFESSSHNFDNQIEENHHADKSENYDQCGYSYRIENLNLFLEKVIGIIFYHDIESNKNSFVYKNTSKKTKTINALLFTDYKIEMLLLTFKNKNINYIFSKYGEIEGYVLDYKKNDDRSNIKPIKKEGFLTMDSSISFLNELLNRISSKDMGAILDPNSSNLGIVDLNSINANSTKYSIYNDHISTLKNFRKPIQSEINIKITNDFHSAPNSSRTRAFKLFTQIMNDKGPSKLNQNIKKKHFKPNPFQKDENHPFDYKIKNQDKNAAFFIMETINQNPSMPDFSADDILSYYKELIDKYGDVQFSKNNKTSTEQLSHSNTFYTNIQNWFFDYILQKHDHGHSFLFNEIYYANFGVETSLKRIIETFVNLIKTHLKNELNTSIQHLAKSGHNSAFIVEPIDEDFFYIKIFKRMQINERKNVSIDNLYFQEKLKTLISKNLSTLSHLLPVSLKNNIVSNLKKCAISNSQKTIKTHIFNYFSKFMNKLLNQKDMDLLINKYMNSEHDEKTSFKELTESLLRLWEKATKDYSFQKNDMPESTTRTYVTDSILDHLKEAKNSALSKYFSIFVMETHKVKKVIFKN